MLWMYSRNVVLKKTYLDFVNCSFDSLASFVCLSSSKLLYFFAVHCFVISVLCLVWFDIAGGHTMDRIVLIPVELLFVTICVICDICVFFFVSSLNHCLYFFSTRKSSLCSKYRLCSIIIQHIKNGKNKNSNIKVRKNPKINNETKQKEITMKRNNTNEIVETNITNKFPCGTIQY